MKVYKFGGASVKNAKAVKNVATIVKQEINPLIVVVSAMGKSTNLLEKIHLQKITGTSAEENFSHFKTYHLEIINELFDKSDKVYLKVNEFFNDLENIITDKTPQHEDFEYARIVSFGELLSTIIVSAFLQKQGLTSQWVDVRKIIQTESVYKNANVNWQESAEGLTMQNIFGDNSIIVTQGFIAQSQEGNVTTLGREGSDFSASILAYLFNADEVCIWKDVPGMLNADPKYFNNTIKLDKISYREAIELSYYGASVIHSKTIKPLQNKQIPLYIKSFENPSEKGSVIQESEEFDHLTPSYIFKPDQLLISISSKDFSFIMEENLSEIFHLFAEVGLEINLMQNSALNFSVLTDNNQVLLNNLLKLISEKYTVRFNEPLRLLTIRHYTPSVISKLSENQEVLLEQKTRNTVRIVLREL